MKIGIHSHIIDIAQHPLKVQPSGLICAVLPLAQVLAFFVELVGTVEMSVFCQTLYQAD